MLTSPLRNIGITRVDGTRSIRECYLSKTVGLLFFASTSAAMAHTVAPVPTPVTTHQTVTTPVVHNTSTVVHPTQTGSTTTTHSAAATQAQQLNLSSTAANISASTLGNFKSITINVGGKTDVVGLNTKVTAAELAAADQVLAGSSQTLTLNTHGQATGGSFTLNNQTAQPLGSISSLTVPTNVKLNDSLSTLNIAGQLLNSGTIQALAGTTGSATIQAGTITNTATGVITTDGTTHSPTALTLAADAITNAGTISATGNLNLNSGTITNSGTIKSTGADVNFTSPNTITLQNTGGLVSAQGNINFREPSYSGANNVNVLGGTLNSQQLNVNTGTGTSYVSGDVSGQLNVNAGVSHVATVSPTLNLGNQSISGDPTYYNQGNILITGSVGVTNGVPLAIVASGNITSDGGSLNTSGPDGGELTLIAGASFTTNDGTTIGSTINPYGPNWGTVLTLTNTSNIGAGSATGGLIDLTGGHGGGAPVSLISTFGTAANGSGGDVNMIAYLGSGTGSGTITLPLNVVITASGQGTGNNGNVNIIAGGVSSGSAIQMGSISSSGGTSHGYFDTGNVLIAAAEPQVLGTVKGTDTFYPFQIVNGATIGGFTLGPTGYGSVNFGNITAQGTLTEQGIGNFVQSGSINIGGNASLGNTGAYYQFAGTTFSAANISITASNTADFEGKMTAQNIGVQMNTTSANVFFSAPGSATASVSAATLTVSNAGVVNIGGTVSTAMTSSFDNTVNIYLTGTGNLDAGGIVLNSQNTTQIGNQLVIANPNGWGLAGTTVVLPFSSLTTVPDAGVGGGVQLNFTTLQYLNQATTPFSIYANGPTTGGLISINANTLLQQTIGATGGNRFFLEATGGTAAGDVGGSVFFSAGGTLFVNPTGISNSGNGGGSINLSSGSSLQVNGSLNTTGSGKAAGDITLSSGDQSNTFLVQASSMPANGVFGSITGGNVTISDSYVQVSQGSFIQTNVSSSSGLQGNLTVNTTTFNQSGTLVVSGGNVTVASPSTLTTSGLGTWSPVGLLTLSASGGLLNVDTLLSQVPITYGGISLSSGYALLLQVNSLTPTPGGTVNMTYSTLSYPNMATTPFTITTSNSTAFNAGAGGAIEITANNGGQQVVGITSNPGGNDFNLYANSTNDVGGAVTFNAGGNLIVNPSYLQNAGPLSGGNLGLSAGTSVQYLGSINQSGSKYAGDVVLTSANAGVFVVGGTTATPTPQNGIVGSITGGNVTISSNGVTLNSSIDSLTSLTTMQPGTITLNTPLFSNLGALNVISGAGNIYVQGTSTLYVNGPGTWSPANQLLFSAASNVNLGSLFSTTAASFHSLTITAPNQLALSTDNLIATPLSSGQGGSINIMANTIGYGTPSTAPLLLSTASTDGGGTVSLTLTAANTLTLGSAANQIEIVTSPTTSGGSFATNGQVAVSSGGNLIVNPSGLVVNQFNNANVYSNITLAGNGNVLMTSWNSSNLESKGNLTITSTSGNTFTVGSTPTIANGIITNTNVIGNSITITSNASGVAIQGTDFLAATAGGTVTVTAENNITGLTNVESISAPTINLNSIIGTIGVIGAPLVINSPTAVSLTAGVGAYVVDNSTTAKTEVPAINTNTLQLVANSTSLDLETGINASNIAVYSKNISQDQGNIGTGLGAVTLNVGATGNIAQTEPVYPPYLVEATTLAVTAGSITGPYGGVELHTQAQAIAFGGATGQIFNRAEFFPITLLQSAASGSLTIDTGGVVTVSQGQNAAKYLLDSWGSVFVDNNIIGSTSVTIRTTSGPPTSSPNAGPSIVAPTITLTSDYGSFTGLNLVTPSLAITTLGAVSATNNPAAAWTFNASTQYQSLTLVSNQPLTVSGSIAISNGNVLLADTGASLTLANGTSLAANNGNIVLEDFNTTSGTVSIGANATVLASATNSQLGYVFVSIGAPPSLAQLTAGVVPANVTKTTSGGGDVFYGTTTNPSGTITASAPTNTLNALGRDISFNDDGRAAAISLGGGVTITADPPAVSGASGIVVPVNVLTAPSFTLAPAALSAATGSSVANAASNSTTATQSVTSPVTNGLSALANVTASTVSQGLSGVFTAPSNSTSSAQVSFSGANLLNASIPGMAPSLNPAAPAPAPSASVDSDQEAAAVSDSRTNVLGGPLQATISKVRKVREPMSKAQADTSIRHLGHGLSFEVPQQNSSIETPFGKIDIAAKSAALLCVTAKGLSVYNFHGPSAESVVVRAGGRSIRINPGSHLTIAPKSFRSFEEVNPAPFIPYRSVRATDLGELRAFASEFQVVSAIKGVKPLQDMVSSLDPEQKKVINRILKSTALMQIMSRDSKPFELMIPAVTAMNQ